MPDPRSSDSANGEPSPRLVRASGGGAAFAAPHPRRYVFESLLSRIDGVQAVRVETSDAGDIERIHLVAEDRVPAGEQVRHVRSALLAAHHVDVDPDRISLVPVHDGEDPGAEPAGAAHERPRLRSLGYQTEGFRVLAQVELEWRGRSFYGVGRDADTAAGRLAAAARAVLDGLERMTGGGAAFFLEGLDPHQAFDRRVLVASVRLVSDGRRGQLVGCARLGESPHKSAVEAVLSAVNRILPRLSYAESAGD
jgi:hypothetical protein